MTIKPLADKVVVKVEEAEQTTASGIVLLHLHRRNLLSLQ